MSTAPTKNDAYDKDAIAKAMKVLTEMIDIKEAEITTLKDDIVNLKEVLAKLETLR